MASDLEICNKALIKIGNTPVGSLEDNKKAARLCKSSWDSVKNQILRDHAWNFAVKRATLDSGTESTVWGFSHKHTVPNDMLRLLEIRDSRVGDYQLEEKSILSNDSVLDIRYIRKVPAEEDITDDLFIDAASARLAFEICEALTQSDGKKKIVWAEYIDALARAKKVDGQENPPVPFSEDNWISIRY